MKPKYRNMSFNLRYQLLQIVNGELPMGVSGN